MKRYEVYCDNMQSYSIKDKTENKTEILVKCDRTDFDKNDEGLKLATFIARKLNEREAEIEYGN